jgi:pyruvate formate lyase activating enzyme
MSDLILPITGFNPNSLIDYPGKISMIFFTQGCNFKCPYCHNSQLIPKYNYHNHDIYTLDDIDMILTEKQRFIDAVVISGGEPTCHPTLLYEFIDYVKTYYDYKVKLDTNGSNWKQVDKLLKDDMLDYVAMDIKTTFGHYKPMKLHNYTKNFKEITESLRQMVKLLTKKYTVDHMFRVTCIKPYVTEDNIVNILRQVPDPKSVVLQKGTHPNAHTDEELERLIQIQQELT